MKSSLLKLAFFSLLLVQSAIAQPIIAQPPTSERISATERSTSSSIVLPLDSGDSAAWNSRQYEHEELWAYRPVVKPEVQAAGSAAIDELLESQWPKGLTGAPLAEAGAFIRRATFDLTGLPPTPEAMAAFELAYQHNVEHAVATLVDSLLDSPHYGERMAQHWLDVVRYADSSGFSNDYERGNAWRYRDYVVRAFNADQPYHHFIRQQIAGDEIDETQPENLIATGFLRMGPWELTGMEVAKVARQRFLDDVTGSVGETFLAQSLQCARCHDHKFDPIATRDYYSMQAIFAATQLVERPAAFLPSENLSGFEESNYLEQARAEHLATLQRLDEKSLAVVKAWYSDRALDRSAWDAALKQATTAQTQPAQKNLAARRRGLFGATRAILLRDGVSEDQFPPRMLGWTTEDIGMERIANKGLERLAWQLDRYQPLALSVYNGATPQVTSVNAPLRLPNNLRQQTPIDASWVLVGGDPFSPGEQVKPGVLSVLAAMQSGSQRQQVEKVEVGKAEENKAEGNKAESAKIPTEMHGRRLALANWIADSKNPLTTRAIVNRLWMWHFDRPIAGNPNNFGSTGKRPTHPELLDWLATTFVEQRWSIKAMHRLIMNSRAYRRSTAHPEVHKSAQLEPMLAHYAVFKPRRLSAEELRDSMLWVTGELNPTLGGIPNRPEINVEVAMQPRQVMGTFAAAWVPNPLPAQRHRRSLYALKLRGLADPFLEVFNAPVADFSCERRELSSVTPQVFSLFNGQATHSRALVLADRIVKEKLDDRQTIERCFVLAFGRLPTPGEAKACLSHWQAMELEEANAPVAGQSPPLEIRRDVLEENTGERFAFTEKLHAHADFVPDLQRADCDARTRALAHVCVVLFNANEFIYVY